MRSRFPKCTGTWEQEIYSRLFSSLVRSYWPLQGSSACSTALNGGWRKPSIWLGCISTWNRTRQIFSGSSSNLSSGRTKYSAYCLLDWARWLYGFASCWRLSWNNKCRPCSGYRHFQLEHGHFCSGGSFPFSHTRHDTRSCVQSVDANVIPGFESDMSVGLMDRRFFWPQV